MRILALTDVHGAYSVAADIIRAAPADVVLIGGDLTTVGSVKEAEDAIVLFKSLCLQVYCVAGNMDSPLHDDLFERLGVSLNARGVLLGDVGFFGVSAAPHSPLRTPYEISEEEIMQRIRHGYADIAHARLKVFVPHAPPYGTKVDIVHSGIHAGSSAVRDFIEEAEPDVVVCGHIHEARGQDRIGASVIVNSGHGARGFYSTVEITDHIEVRNLQQRPPQ